MNDEIYERLLNLLKEHEKNIKKTIKDLTEYLKLTKGRL